MSLAKFDSTPRAQLSPDLLDLRLEFGGKPGELSVGTQRITVLRVDKGLYFTTDKPSPAVKTAVALAGEDLHYVRSMSDLTYLKVDYRRFLRG